MLSRNKIDKKNKQVFTILPDRLCQDSSEEYYDQMKSTDKANIIDFSFPLEEQLKELHENQENKPLSEYVKFLQDQVKNISNDIEFQYHKTRESLLFLGQTTGSFKLSRKKIDQQMQKLGVVRPFDSSLKKLQGQAQISDVGQLTIKSIKRKIQRQWESEICDQIQKQKRKQKQAERRKIKQLQQIDKDFDRIMKKRKTLKEQLLLKSQLSINSMPESNNNITAKKDQKRHKIERKASNRKIGDNSEVESSSICNNSFQAQKYCNLDQRNQQSNLQIEEIELLMDENNQIRGMDEVEVLEDVDHIIEASIQNLPWEKKLIESVHELAEDKISNGNQDET